MAEFEEKLNAILGDPEAMGQIVSIAKALTGGDGSDTGSAVASPDAADTPAVDTDTPAAPVATGGGETDWSSLLGLLGTLGGNDGGNPLAALGDLDPRLIQGALTLYSEYSTTDDRKIALLGALKPFLKEERYAKVDKAIQIAKLSRVIRVAFRLFKKDGGEAGV